MQSNLHSTPTTLEAPAQKIKEVRIVLRFLLALIALALMASFFVIVNAGERGVLMTFGKVQPQILDEGIHFIVPLVNTVKKFSVRVQIQAISAEASSKDLQDVFTDVALNWHIIPEKANWVFQNIGDRQAVIERIINPSVEEILKAIMAKYTAEEIITKREEVKSEVDQLLTSRLQNYSLVIDDVSLVHVHFSQRFSDAVEAKQIAEQESKRAEFVAQKAIREAEARVNLAKGEAEAQRLLKETLTPILLEKQTIEKWDGRLPLIMDKDSQSIFDFKDFFQSNPELQAPPLSKAK